MRMVVEWTVPIVALLSFIVSVVTLYVAHLRGPSIRLVSPGKLYPLAGGRNISTRHEHTFKVYILIANLGIRPGILYDLRVSSEDEVVTTVRVEPKTDETLPTALLPGAGYRVKCEIVCKMDGEEEWRKYLAQHEVARISVTFSYSTAFRSYVRKKEGLEIDLSHIRKYYQK